MRTDTRRGVPGVPLAALDAIPDQNTRQVLQSIIDGWHVRNGVSGNGDSRFITAAELAEIKGSVGGLSASLNALATQNQQQSQLTGAQINRIINDLQASVMESALWKTLGERITLLDDKYSLEVEGLAQELNNVVDGVTDITVVTDTGSSSIRAMKNTIYDPVSGVQASSAMIGQINNISLTSTSANARALAGVQATVYDPNTGLAAAHSAIIALNDVSATSTSANARYLFSVNAYVGQKNKVFFQIDPPTSTASYTLRVNDLWFDSDDKNKPYRWNGSAWLESSDGRIADAMGAVTTEQTVRVNQDNVLATAINTVWAAIGDNSALVQSGAQGLVNNAGAVAQSWNQTQADIKDPNTGAYISSATVRQETKTVASRADGLEAQWTVKTDVNGYVSGFGLASTLRGSTPFSEFIVRADRFAIGTPSGSTAQEVVPFIVTTTPTLLPDGTTRQAGVYMNYSMVNRLDGAYIYAAMMEAGKIYTGSQYIDYNSKQPINAVASGSWQTDSVSGWSSSDPNYRATSTGLAMYGPAYHTMVNQNQRVKAGNVYFQISANAMVDHWMTLWYRINNGAWTPATTIIEPQSSYGFGAINYGKSVYVTNSWYIEFGLSATNTAYQPLDANKVLLQYLTINVMAVNL